MWEPRYPDPEQELPKCIHCGQWTTFRDDPSPDLCVLCRRRGLFSPMWGADEDQRYTELVGRLQENSQRREELRQEAQVNDE